MTQLTLAFHRTIAFSGRVGGGYGLAKRQHTTNFLQDKASSE